MNLLTRQKETHRKLSHGCQGEGVVKDSGKVLYTLLRLKWITNKNLLFSMELCSMLCASLDGKGVWGRMDA